MLLTFNMCLVHLALATLLAVSACTPEEDPFINTEAEGAAAIRAATPTELPPVTAVGAGTMGAYIIPTPGSELHRLAGEDTILFVASGVERGGSIGTISTSCRPFQNWRHESSEYVVISGHWCPRPEIGMDFSQVFNFWLFDTGMVSFSYSFDPDGDNIDRLGYRLDSLDQSGLATLFRRPSERIAAATVNDLTLYGWLNATDSIILSNFRVDATYGSTP